MPEKIRAIRTYEVAVRGFDPVVYCARSAAKARWRCFQDFRSAFNEVMFGRFLKDSTIRRVADPPGVGQRIIVCGKPATRIYHSVDNHYVYFMRDDSDVVLCAHPADVAPLRSKESTP